MQFPYKNKIDKFLVESCRFTGADEGYLPFPLCGASAGRRRADIFRFYFSTLSRGRSSREPIIIYAFTYIPFIRTTQKRTHKGCVCVCFMTYSKPLRFSILTRTQQLSLFNFLFETSYMFNGKLRTFVG